uniref:t-SNARE coiled-coil homology domain-containing protein n=1 Tax=Arcella intermedia TaxID=1963864 RepID=A0A6B2LCB2_9EUKA
MALINKKASEIGRKTSLTTQELKKLTELARCNMAFGDPAAQIEHLTVTITRDINHIKAEIEQLEQLIARHAAKNQAADHSASVIHSLNTDLLRTTIGLNDALQLRNRNLKAQEERRSKLVGERRPGQLPAPKYIPIINDEEDQGNGDDVVIQFNNLQANDLIINRANAVREIEVHITEIQAIFKKLASLVALQNEQIQRIGDNVDTTMIHSESALQELLKYLQGMSSDRWLIIKVFVIIMFFLFLWFMFFA